MLMRVYRGRVHGNDSARFFLMSKNTHRVDDAFFAFVTRTRRNATSTFAMPAASCAVPLKRIARAFLVVTLRLRPFRTTVLRVSA